MMHAPLTSLSRSGRIQHPRWFALTFVVGTVLACAFAAPAKPNVLFIMADDYRPELGSYGTPAKTPNLDRLASAGVRFTDAHSSEEKSVFIREDRRQSL